MEKGDPQAASQLLPLVYEELRQLAMRKMAREAPGQTLSATALVHEAYLRLVGTHDTPQWDSRGHFFAAAAEAMRRILVDNARRKQSLKRGANLERQDLDECDIAMPEVSDDVLVVDEALTKLAQIDNQSAELVKLRCFAGLTNVEAAAALGISPRSADRLWAFARAWLYQNIHGT
jgi:RNA polymerase sigma factor (TIGR02999 family)